MLTKKQLIKFLEEETEDGEYDYEESNLYRLEEEETLTLDGYKIKQVDQEGGEGEGDNYFVVFSVKKEDEEEFWMIPGWYASHDGHTLNTEDMYKVKQVEKVIKVWKSIK